MMKAYNNMKVTARILASVITIMIFLLVIGGVGIYSLAKTDRDYTEQFSITTDAVESLNIVTNTFYTLRIKITEIGFYIGDDDKCDDLYNKSEGDFKTLEDAAIVYKDVLIKSGLSTNSIDDFISNIAKYKDGMKNVINHAKTGVRDRTFEAIEELRSSVGNSMTSTLDKISSDSFTEQHNVSDELTKNTETTMAVEVAILLIGTVFAAIIVLMLSNSIKKPLAGLMQTAEALSNGNLDITSSSNYHDELGNMTNQMGMVIDTLNKLITEINTTSREIDVNGDVEARLDSSRFLGGYKEVADSINIAIGGLTKDTLALISALQEFASGNFSSELQRFQGKKAIMNHAFDKLKGNLVDISKEVSSLATEASIGHLDAKMDENKYDNDWRTLAKSLNNLVVAIATPINEAGQVLGEVSLGVLSVNMKGDYKGQFKSLADSINKTISQLNTYVRDISDTLGELSNDNYDLSVEIDYQGDFAPIKNGLNVIIDRINIVMSDINSSADQVAAGARQISESSMSLSQGATEQAGSVEEMNATIENIAEQTKQSASIADQANELAAESQRNAVSSNKDMMHMLTAMTEISDASSKISNIIKIIDEIAFQTNLLALNAAVEAAHAGTHGRGFAVVAEQVRTLAARSSDAAKDSTDLIETSLEKVSEGTKIANQTAAALEKVVSDITQISSLINNIAGSSKEQTISLEQINIGIGQISQVTQTNTATSEEEAASAQELSSQAETFRSMVQKFKIKRKYMM